MDAVIALAKYTRDLLSKPETVVKLGRDNWQLEDFSQEYILIDELTPPAQLQSSTSYDGDTEIMTFTNRMRGGYTIDFYGSTALANAQMFQGLRYSQSSYELQYEHGITVYNVGVMVDLKNLTGKTYNTRYQINLQCGFNTSVSTPILRIDEAVFEIYESEKGLVYQSS